MRHVKEGIWVSVCVRAANAAQYVWQIPTIAIVGSRNQQVKKWFVAYWTLDTGLWICDGL